MIHILTQHTKQLVAISLVLFAYWTARLPTISDDERRNLSERFSFQSEVLPTIEGSEVRHVRPVHSSLEHISAWISSVGAAIALGDLDGDQFPNDVCYVDTRTDQVIVAPVPDSGLRFEPFLLEHSEKFFNRATMAPMGCIPGDYNEDGLGDILVYYWGRTPIVFLRAQSMNVSTQLSAKSFVSYPLLTSSERWYTNAATQADVDGDGHLDLIFGNYFADESKTLDTSAAGTEWMQDSMSRAFNGGRNRLLLWKGASAGEVDYTDESDAFTAIDERIATGWTLAVAAADLDGDLLPEIYFANDFGPDRLLHNRSSPGCPEFAQLEGVRTWTTPSSKVLGRDSFKGMGVDFGDLNGDGILDIYVSNIASEYALEESHFAFVSTGQSSEMQTGRAPYVDASESLGLSRSGWGWETRLADFDNDGVLEAIQACGFVQGDTNRWPELHEIAMGNDQLLRYPNCWHQFQTGDDLSGHDHNAFFVRANDGRFYDIAPEVGLGESYVTRGIALADIECDGDLDLAIGNQWNDSYFIRNEAPRTGAFLGLRLLLPTQQGSVQETLLLPGIANPPHPVRPAIGTIVTLRLPDGRELVGYVDGGNGHSGVRSPEIHFGLGELPLGSIMTAEVRWRDSLGSVQFESLRMEPGWHTLVLAN